MDRKEDRLKLKTDLPENSFQQQLSKTWSRISKLVSDVAPYILKLFPIAVDLYRQYEEVIQRRYELRQSVMTLWNELDEELRTKNRYFPKSQFIELFDKCTQEAKYTLRKGSVLYRARKIETECFPDEVKTVLNEASQGFNAYAYQKSLIMENDIDIWDFIENIADEDWNKNYIEKNSLQNSSFWGYDAKNSDAPPKNTAHGRANPAGISYLYASREYKTALSEIQPTIGQFVSLVKIKTRKSLKVFDFDILNAFKDAEIMQLPIDEFNHRLGMSYWDLKTIFETIAELFSQPALGDSQNYLATQYISEYIKNKGFDGIRFKSTLTKSGQNIVLFDTSKDGSGNPNNYVLMDSSLYRTNNVTVTAKKLLPRNPRRD